MYATAAGPRRCAFSPPSSPSPTARHVPLVARGHPPRMPSGSG
uniref:Uncharacterized protein n=1 Tax=Setaria italica TaxID=4555 RepID=K3YNT9_SETIT